jgi:hypothetical protein
VNTDHLLETFNRHQVRYILVGGVNFLLRHAPVLTFDIDLWIRDDPENLRRCEQALASLDAAWGRDDADWKPVADQTPGWLGQQGIFCLTSPYGAIDIFKFLLGVDNWDHALSRSTLMTTGAGAPIQSLSDEDMIALNWRYPKQTETKSEFASCPKPERSDLDMVQPDLKTREERKRDRHWLPGERWHAMQAMIAWAESQGTVKRNTPAQCRAKERRLLSTSF